MPHAFARTVNSPSNRVYDCGFVVSSRSPRLLSGARLAAAEIGNRGRRVIAESLGVLKAALELFGASGRQMRVALLHGAVTALLFGVLYIGVSSARNGFDLSAGWAAAFPIKVAPIPDQAEKAVAAQYELRAHAASDLVITHLLQGLLGRSHGASRVRLGQIHNGVTGITGASILKYDITNAVAAPGRAAGDMVTDQPLSEWSDFLQAMIGGRCSFKRFADVANFNVKARLASMHVEAFLACPLVDPESRTVGGLFVNWGDGDPLPAGVDLEALIADSLGVGRQLAVALDVRLPIH